MQAQYMNEQIQIERKQRNEINQTEDSNQNVTRKIPKFDRVIKQEKEINVNNWYLKLLQVKTMHNEITKYRSRRSSSFAQDF